MLPICSRTYASAVDDPIGLRELFWRNLACVVQGDQRVVELMLQSVQQLTVVQLRFTRQKQPLMK